MLSHILTCNILAHQETKQKASVKDFFSLVPDHPAEQDDDEEGENNRIQMHVRFVRYPQVGQSVCLSVCLAGAEQSTRDRSTSSLCLNKCVTFLHLDYTLIIWWPGGVHSTESDAKPQNTTHTQSAQQIESQRLNSWFRIEMKWGESAFESGKEEKERQTEKMWFKMLPGTSLQSFKVYTLNTRRPFGPPARCSASWHIKHSLNENLNATIGNRSCHACMILALLACECQNSYLILSASSSKSLSNSHTVWSLTQTLIK